MERKSRISLDNPVFRGRRRASRGVAGYVSRQSLDGFHTAQPKPTPNAPQAPTQKEPTHPLLRPVLEAKPSASSKPRPHLPKQTRSHVLKRQMVKNSSKRYRPKHRRPLVPTLLSGMAIVFIMVGLLTAFSTIRTNRDVKAQVKGLSSELSEDSEEGVPSEEDPPTDLSSYKVAPDMPQLLTINKIGVNARVRRLGVSPSNILKAPANIFDVGWYDASAKPGEDGTTVMDGHVSGPTKRGVFHNIGSLKAGDNIEIERGDGQIFSYMVVDTKVYDNNKVDMAKVMTTAIPGKPGLNLITCTGRFNVRTNTYEQRVVVFAVQD